MILGATVLCGSFSAFSVAAREELDRAMLGAMGGWDPRRPEAEALRAVAAPGAVARLLRRT